MIPVFKPHIDAKTIKAAVDALELGWLGMGSYVKEFEEKLTKYFELPPGRKLVAVNTCTSALHLALLVAGVGPGDEVITPALNNIGDFQAIAMCGARPVFVDIGEADLALDPEKIAPLIGPKVKAIIALHYMGIPCAIDRVYEVARTFRLRLIEDAAHATGTRVLGRPIGSDRDLACFSFDAIKTLTCIDGGAVITPSEEEANRLYPARLLGMTQSNDRLYSNARAYQYDVPGPGFRYHLANLHANIGISQLRSLPEFIANRRSYCERYKLLLSDLPGIILPQGQITDASMFLYVVRVLDNKRGELIQHLKKRGVDTGVHWIPGNQYTWLRECRGAGQLPVTDRVGQEIMSLPLWSAMTDDVIETVAGSIREFYGCSSVKVGRRRADGQELVHSLKNPTSRPNHPYIVPIAGHDDMRLRAVVAADPLPEDVQRLTEWRNRHVKSFLTEFTATPERTRRWLTDAIAGDDTRILFMIENVNGRVLGYIGLAKIDWLNRTAEADSVVRGEEGAPGLMTSATRALLDWGRLELGLRQYFVRVLNDNDAMGFYRKIGFQEQRRVALHRVTRPDCVAWEEAIDAASDDGRCLIHMEYHGA